MAQKVLFAWSGGKDSAMAFYETRRDSRYEVVALLTTVTQDYGRISMHGVRKALLKRQAASLGLALEEVRISKDASNETYEARMGDVLSRHKRKGVCGVVFGDIFLDEVKKYRQEKLAGAQMKAFFPIWKRETRALALSFIEAGFRAVTTCIDTNVLDESFVGREFDGAFVSGLPAEVDPCGENGEFHTFVYDGPIFREKIAFERGEGVLRDGRFWYCDLLPVGDLACDRVPATP